MYWTSYGRDWQIHIIHITHCDSHLPSLRLTGAAAHSGLLTELAANACRLIAVAVWSDFSRIKVAAARQVRLTASAANVVHDNWKIFLTIVSLVDCLGWEVQSKQSRMTVYLCMISSYHASVFCCFVKYYIIPSNWHQVILPLSCFIIIISIFLPLSLSLTPHLPVSSPYPENPSCLQTTLMSLLFQPSSHTTPHWPERQTSTRPSLDVAPPESLTLPSLHCPPTQKIA